MTMAPVQIPSFQTLSKDLGATALRRGLNLWPPFLAASVHVDRISADFREFDVSLRMRPWSRNYVGTQFGGSLFAMCDPWWMLGALRCLGDEYIVWDKAGEIDFVSPGRTDVRTSIRSPTSCSTRSAPRRLTAASTWCGATTTSSPRTGPSSPATASSCTCGASRPEGLAAEPPSAFGHQMVTLWADQ